MLFKELMVENKQVNKALISIAHKSLRAMPKEQALVILAEHLDELDNNEVEDLIEIINKNTLKKLINVLFYELPQE